MAGVHRLDHVESLPSPALTDDDTVRAHPQAVLDQFPDGNLALAFNILRLAFKPHDVVLLQIQLRRIFNRDDPLPIRIVGGERALSIVVLPEPVPPEMTMFSVQWTHALRNIAMLWESARNAINFSIVSGLLLNLRMVITGPLRASGGMMTLTPRTIGQSRVAKAGSTRQRGARAARESCR